MYMYLPSVALSARYVTEADARGFRFAGVRAMWTPDTEALRVLTPDTSVKQLIPTALRELADAIEAGTLPEGANTYVINVEPDGASAREG